MRFRIAFIAWLLSIACELLGQSPESTSVFDAVSVKAAPDRTTGGGVNLIDIQGGPGTSDPGRIRYTNIDLKTLIRQAFDLPEFQLSGPTWLDSTRCDIVGTLMRGATKVQVNVMLQNLLKDRFNLAFHHELKELAVYELVVGTSGAKLHEAAPIDQEWTYKEPLRVGPDGYYNFPPGYPRLIGTTKDGSVRISARLQTMADLAGNLSTLVGRPILDRTGLDGAYDFTLGFSRIGLPIARPSDPDLGEADLFRSIQVQLGLKLESARDKVNIMVIDHMDRTPSPN